MLFLFILILKCGFIFIAFFFFLAWLGGRDRDLPNTCTTLSGTQSQEISLAVPHRGRDIVIWAITCCFLGCSFVYTGIVQYLRELNLSTLIWDTGVLISTLTARLTMSSINILFTENQFWENLFFAETIISQVRDLLVLCFSLYCLFTAFYICSYSLFFFPIVASLCFHTYCLGWYYIYFIIIFQPEILALLIHIFLYI